MRQLIEQLSSSNLEKAIQAALKQMNPPGDSGNEARAAKRLKQAMDSGDASKMEDAIRVVVRDFGHLSGALGRVASRLGDALDDQ